MASDKRRDVLDERAQTLLRILVDKYIREGQPVGSRTLSRDSGLDLSPATIRNIMSDLEELGFVDSPHTSAGRIPTIKGYRFFVDTLIKLTPPNGDDLLRFGDDLHAVPERLGLRLARRENLDTAFTKMSEELLGRFRNAGLAQTSPQADRFELLRHLSGFFLTVARNGC